jgi:arsenate reductase
VLQALDVAKMKDLLNQNLEQILSLEIPEERREILQVLIDYIKDKRKKEQPIRLNFICTHNSRRSQFSQVWAQTAADYFQIPAQCYSGGVEVTACNERTVASLERMGFIVSKRGHSNPIYFAMHTQDSRPIILFSKLFDDVINPHGIFASVMTCSHADENCPFIPGAEARIPVRYEDPKAFDDTPEEAAQYDARSRQIAGEMFYVFSRVSI